MMVKKSHKIIDSTIKIKEVRSVPLNLVSIWSNEPMADLIRYFIDNGITYKMISEKSGVSVSHIRNQLSKTSNAGLRSLSLLVQRSIANFDIPKQLKEDLFEYYVGSCEYPIFSIINKSLEFFVYLPNFNYLFDNTDKIRLFNPILERGIKQTWFHPNNGGLELSMETLEAIIGSYNLEDKITLIKMPTGLNAFPFIITNPRTKPDMYYVQTENAYPKGIIYHDPVLVCLFVQYINQISKKLKEGISVDGFEQVKINR